jgi:hypothetical protein
MLICAACKCVIMADVSLVMLDYYRGVEPGEETCADT